MFKRILFLFFFGLQLLKLLNSNTENPNLIWDNGTRAEIMKYLEEEQERKISTVCVKAIIIIRIIIMIRVFNIRCCLFGFVNF